MPVEDVHLVDLHQVEHVQDGRLGLEVPGGVNQEAAVREARAVQHVTGVKAILG